MRPTRLRPSLAIWASLCAYEASPPVELAPPRPAAERSRGLRRYEALSIGSLFPRGFGRLGFGLRVVATRSPRLYAKWPAGRRHCGQRLALVVQPVTHRTLYRAEVLDPGFGFLLSGFASDPMDAGRQALQRWRLCVGPAAVVRVWVEGSTRKRPVWVGWA